MTFKYQSLIALGLVFFGHTVNAQDKLHQDFLAAEKVAKKGRVTPYKKSFKTLEHPLKPYVELAFLERNTTSKYQVEIANFLQIYEGTPLEWPLRKKWLYALKKRGKKAEFINAYKSTSDAKLSCTYLAYQLQLGAPSEAIYKQVDDLWTVGKSQPKECNWVFKKWRDSGHLTDELIWQRVTLAAQKGNTSLLPYLKTLLPKNERYLADLYKTMRQDPSASAGLYRFKKRTEKEGEIALYGVKRLIWRDRDLAIRAWNKLEKMFDYSEPQKQQLYYTFALSLASNKHSQAKFFLNKVADEYHDSKLMQWQLSNMLKEQDWAGIVAYFTGKRLENGHQYWLAYAHNMRGESEKAHLMWQSLAKKRDYYGFLAAARLDKPVSLQHQSSETNQVEIDKVSQSPGYKRAVALFELGRLTQARREWNALMKGSTKKEKLAAASLAASMGWHDSVIIVMAQLKLYHMLDLRFPQPHAELFEKYSKRHDVDVNWSYAIARRESSFASDAHSSAGAIGLMQLLPSTARYMNKARVSRSQLKQPKINVRLGTKYLNYLKDKSDGNEVIATASYNAGYHKVKRWLPKEGVDFDLWVEAIPYRETRNYVKNVFAYRQVYQTRMGSDENLFDELVELQIKR